MNKSTISAQKEKMDSSLHIAVIILNYNSEQDLKICAEQVVQQQSVRLSIILVDNASRAESLAVIKTWLTTWRSEAVCGMEDEVHAWIHQNPELARDSGKVYLIENHENRGYSAGNNVGIRLADALGADAVLIANPDMRIENQNYLTELSKELFANSQNFVAASKIIDLNGVDQNPLREPTFLEELFWPRWLLRKFSKKISYIIETHELKSVPVPKVAGCCMLIKMSFLRRIGYLDENVFLYCEEPILSAKVRTEKGCILYVPMVAATHAHIRCEKDNDAKRMLLFIKSRKYYLKIYSGYNKLMRGFLYASYAVLSNYYWLKFGRSK